MSATPPKARSGDSRQAFPGYGDPITAPFWDAATREELLVQRCTACGHHQFYPRRFCLECSSEAVEWVRARGTGTVYSQTTVHVQIATEFEPPYVAALVELDEGPRLLTNLEGPCAIGDRVAVRWRERQGLPPLPVFTPDRPGAEH